MGKMLSGQPSSISGVNEAYNAPEDNVLTRTCSDYTFFNI